jgi:hypothetical protein
MVITKATIPPSKERLWDIYHDFFNLRDIKLMTTKLAHEIMWSTSTLPLERTKPMSAADVVVALKVSVVGIDLYYGTCHYGVSKRLCVFGDVKVTVNSARKSEVKR